VWLWPWEDLVDYWEIREDFVWQIEDGINWSAVVLGRWWGAFNWDGFLFF
jgi:hypothetical protein